MARSHASDTANTVALYGTTFAENPDHAYAQLRQHGPVARGELAPGIQATFITDYRVALDVLRDPTTFARDPRRWQRGLPQGHPILATLGYRPSCLYSDGDQHKRLRAAINDSLARIDPTALRDHVERSADSLIDGFGPAGTADLVSQYAQHLPILVVGHLLGCPVSFVSRLVPGGDRGSCLQELVALKREQPGADVASWLAGHPAGLTDEELLHELSVLLGTGTEAEQNLIANALLLLLADDRFAGDLAGGTLPVEDALDEVLWTKPPLANYAIAYPTQDVDLGGTSLPAGEPVIISLGAASIAAEWGAGVITGNRAHLAFGAGPHACPAQRPARLIATVAVEKLLEKLPGMRLTLRADQLAWSPGPFHRAITALPVQFPPTTHPNQP